MEGFLDDLVSSLAHHAQDAPARLKTIASAAAAAAVSATPGRGAAAKNLSQPAATLFWNKPSNPPSNLDLVYITDRIIASSEPAYAPVPIFSDKGRDEKANLTHVVSNASNNKLTTKRQTSAISSLSTSTSRSKEYQDDGIRAVAESNTLSEKKPKSTDNPQEGGSDCVNVSTSQSTFSLPQHHEANDPPLQQIHNSSIATESQRSNLSGVRDEDDEVQEPVRPGQPCPPSPAKDNQTEQTTDSIPLESGTVGFEEANNEVKIPSSSREDSNARSSEQGDQPDEVSKPVDGDEFVPTSPRREIVLGASEQWDTPDEQASSPQQDISKQLSPRIEVGSGDSQECSVSDSPHAKSSVAPHNGPSPTTADTIKESIGEDIVGSLSGLVEPQLGQGPTVIEGEQPLQTPQQALQNSNRDVKIPLHKNDTSGTSPEAHEIGQEREVLQQPELNGDIPISQADEDSDGVDQEIETAEAQGDVGRIKARRSDFEDQPVNFDIHQQSAGAVNEPITKEYGAAVDVDRVKHDNNASSEVEPTCSSESSLAVDNAFNRIDNACNPGNDSTGSILLSPSAENFSVDESRERDASKPVQQDLFNNAAARGTKNSPAAFANYLERRHGRRHFLGFSLTDKSPDDRTLLLLRRQIVQLGWWSPCLERSETPSVIRILQLCYALHAYLQLDDSNIVWVYCSNGKTRTAIAIACYLKFAGLVQYTSDGFLHFLLKRGVQNQEKILQQLPPSLHLFFRQFDSVIDVGGFLNQKPLLLRAIALQGIPVEEKPCLDIWDSSQQHVYSSHPEMWQQDKQSPLAGLTQNDRNLKSQWADEEGFYRVNVVLDGDFLLLCRFGGEFAHETAVHDPSKILFRYANSTGFLSGGCPYELPPNKVDLMRRYAQHLDDDEFLVTLLFEAYWDGGLTSNETIPADVAEQLRASSRALSSYGDGVWKCNEPGACEQGLKIIFENHSAHPNATDVEAFRLYHSQEKKLAGYASHLISLSLQLTNFDLVESAALLSNKASPLCCWQLHHSSSDKISNVTASDYSKLEAASSAFGEGSSRNIFDILDRTDVESCVENSDLVAVSCSNGVAPLSTTAGVRQVRNSCQDVNTPRRHGGRPLCNDNSGEGGRHAGAFVIPNIKASGWMVPGIVNPKQGDILNSFGPHYGRIQCALQSQGITSVSTPVAKGSLSPRIQLFPLDRPSVLPRAYSTNKAKVNDVDQGSNLIVPPYNTKQELAYEMLQNMIHTGVDQNDLFELANASLKWGPEIVLDEVIPVDDKTNAPSEEQEIQLTGSTDSKHSSMNKEAKEQQEKKWEEARKAEAREKEEKQQIENKNRKELEARQKEEDQKTAEIAPKQEADGSEGAEITNQEDLLLKDDPEYAKYFKMLKLGMAKEQVLHALQRDGKDPIILDLDPNKSLKSQSPSNQTDSSGEIPLKDDPEYSKYFKMLKMGLPMGAVKNALGRDGKDPSVMELDPNKSLNSQLKQTSSDDDGLPLKDDPEFAKYFKMLAMGLPIGAVKNSLSKDGKDPAVMDLDPTKSFKAQMEGKKSNDGPPLKEDPDYSKYFKMLAMGLPMGAVKNAMSRDGKDPSVMDLDPEKSFKAQMGGGDLDDGPPLKEDPEYVKYFKMLSMGLPMGAVKNALSRDGKDPATMDLDPNKSLKSQQGSGEKDMGVPLKEDPEYSKYFKMLGMGLPLGAVKNAMERDGKNASVMDLDPNKSVAYQLKKKNPVNKIPAKKKKRVRRKKIYWNPIDPGKLKEDSMWTLVRDSVRMGELNYDPKEFEDLFTESADPADQKKKKGGGNKKKEKKAVQVIDGKRDMNGGIILTRLKTDNDKIADIVDKMEHGKFDATQLKALKEYLPDADERRGLITFMKKGEASEEAQAKAYAELSQTEKYMVRMIDVKNAAEKFDALLFRTIFKTRFEDVTDAIKTLNKACEEVRSSERLRKLMAMILTVVNQINTGGEGKMALGFTLDALLKLNEAKAFDRKTSVLHYLVKLLKKNDESLLHFDSDLGSVNAAENVILDSLSGDVKAISEELNSVHGTVAAEAERLEEAGELKPMTLADLQEQRTAVRHVGLVPQYNKIDHKTGRTSMERFVLNARIATDQAAVSIDDVKKKYSALLGYFGEDPQMSTTDFFGTLRRFIVEFKKATEQVEAIEKAAAKERKRAARAAEKAARANGKKTSKETSHSKKAGPGGIAALAAAAAKRQARSFGNSSEIGPPGGSEAMVATAKQENATGTGGGISALAAAAAAAAEARNSKVTGVVAEVSDGVAVSRVDTKARKYTIEDDTVGNGGQSIPEVAAAAVLRKTNSSKPVGESSPNTGVVDSERSDSNVEQRKTVGASVPEFEAAESHLKKRSSEGNIYKEKGEPANADQSYNSDEDASGKSAFAAKAAAYRKRKENKEDKDVSNDQSNDREQLTVPECATAVAEFDKRNSDSKAHDEKGEPTGDEATNVSKNVSQAGGRSSFLASAAAYRKKKSMRDLYGDDALKSPVSRKSNTKTSMVDKLPKLGAPEWLSSPSGVNVHQSVQTARSFDSLNTASSGLKPRESPLPAPPLIEQHPTVKPGRSFDSFFAEGEDEIDLTPNRQGYGGVLRDFDDSSVALLDDKRPVDARMTDSWVLGDTIPNWMGWANQVIKASDTDSVVGFEESMDLKDFDDDSTIATFMDDVTVASVTPAKVASSILYDDDEEDIPSVTPAKVAATILFNDSPVTSLDGTPSKSNVHRKPADELGLDAGLTFGVKEVGLLDGLSFGVDAGLTFGVDEFGIEPGTDEASREENEGSLSPLKVAKWFKWGNN